MDGSYGHPARRAQSPMSLQSPATSAYQVNVSRKKTRKWVEAKVQSYSGDDWGGDEFEDESDAEPAPPPPPPQALSTLRTYSGTELTSGRHGNASPSPSSSLSTLPSLRVQTQPTPPPSAPAIAPQPIGVTSPVVSDLSIRSSSDNILGEHLVSPQSASTYTFNRLSLAAASQPPSQFQQQRAPGGYDISRSTSFDPEPRRSPEPSAQLSALSISQPPEPYHPIGDHDNRAPEPTEAEVGGPFRDQRVRFSSTPKLLSEQDRRDTWERDDDSIHSYEYGQPVNQYDSQEEARAAPEETGPERSSINPMLPDVTRISAFGTGLFATAPENAKGSSTPEHQVSASPEQHSRSSTPRVGGKAVTSGEIVRGVVEAEEEESTEASGGAPLRPPARQSLIPHPGRGLPPLKTPSPHEPRTAVAVTDSLSTKITPTEPLQPRKAGDVPTDPEHVVPQSASTYSTLTLSPLKESDILRDEIIRSLSPGGPIVGDVRLGDNFQLLPPASRNAARESSYTLKDYDSYWADTSDKSEYADNRDASAPTSVSLNTSSDLGPIPHHAQNSAGYPSPNFVYSPASQTMFEGTLSSEGSGVVRRRFSWEAEEERISAPEHGEHEEHESHAAVRAGGSATPTLKLIAPPPEPSAASSGLNLANEPDSHSPASQVSNARESSSVYDVPSPLSVSVESDRVSAMTREQAPPSLADDGVPAQQPTPPPEENQPAPLPPASATFPAGPQTSSPQSQAKIMTFREIAALPTAVERISKYNETRQLLAAKDSGLENWLAALRARHPDLAAAAASSSGSGSQPPAQSGKTSSPVGSQPSTQQPYYQQYLNASSPSATAPQAGRSRLGSLAMASQMTGSAFGHSGNQLGTKGKEFMHSAGKMGKGLLSKGKSKLRASGDKGDLSPTGPPIPAKSERRATWRFSWDPKSREYEYAPHASEEMVASQPTPPPQLPDPFGPASGLDSVFEWNIAVESPDSETPDGPHVPPLSIPSRRKDQLYLEEGDLSHEVEESLTQAEWSNNAADHVPRDDWVMVSRRSDGSQPHEDSGVGLKSQSSQSQPQPDSDSPKRNSSFIGLPPIRRGSTFGLKSKVRRVSERFSLDDDDEAGPPEFTHDANEPPPPPPESVANESRNEEDDASAHDEQGPAIMDPLANPIRRLPPAGPWKLEESHLSEPLHLTKKRSNTDFPKQQVFYGYEKELGLEYPATPMPPPPQPHFPGRLRSDVPPSSAQRYPELFVLRQEVDQRQWGHGQHHPSQFQPRFPQEELAMRKPQKDESETSGGVTVTNERGRKKRNSAIFKDIGTRFARAASKERSNSLTESRPQSRNLRSDEVSETGGVTEDVQDRRKKKLSFLGLSSRRSSIDPISGPQRPQPDAVLPGTPSSHRDRKRSLLGATQVKFGPGGVALSSTSSFDVESSKGLGNESPEGVAPQKKRLSHIAKATGVAGLFARSKQDRSSMERPPYSAGSDRLTSSRGYETSGHHSRQGSSSSLVPGILGHPITPKTRDQPQSEHVEKPQQPEAPVPLEVSRLRTSSLGPARSPSPLSARHVSEPLSSQVRPSPLGTTTPSAMSDEKSGRDIRGASRSPPAAGEHRHDGDDHFETPPEYSPTALDSGQPRLQDLDLEQNLALAEGVGFQIPGSGGAESLRRLTVSPNVSVTSDGRIEEQGRGHERGRKHEEVSKLHVSSEKHREGPPGHPALRPEQAPPSFPSVPPLSEQMDNERGGAPTSQEPSPQGSQSLVPEQPAPAASQPLPPSYSGRSHGEDMAGGRASPQGQRLLGKLGQRTHTAPSGVSSASGASREAAPKPLADANGQKEGHHSRWKGIKSRVSAQISQEHNHMRAGVGEKIKAKKLLEALKRGSKLAETPQAQGQTKPQQPRNDRQQVPPTGQQSQSREQSEAAPAYSPPTHEYQSQQGRPMSPEQAEPRYAQVPIPRGYTAVHGEGMIVPSPYKHGPNAPHSGSSPPREPQVNTEWHEQQQQQQHPVALNPLQGQTLSSAQETVQNQVTGHSGAPSAWDQGAPLSEGNGNTAHFQGDENNQSYSRRYVADGGQGLGITAAGPEQQSGFGAPGRNGVGFGSSGMAGVDLRSASRSPETVMERAERTGDNRQQTSSFGFFNAAQGQRSPGDDMYDATPRLIQNDTGAGHGRMEGLRTAWAESATGSGGLEVTEEARQRVLEESQAEKIPYDPDDYEPKMSATSYPGQEWNPYGDPEFAADWGDD